MFYKETIFQYTQAGKIPKDWRCVEINQVCEVRRGASPRPINDPKYFSEYGRGWVRIADVTASYKYLRKTSQYLSKLGESKSVKVNPGDLIMSICATIGKPIIVDMEACIHDGFVVFRNLSKEVDVEFLFYMLQKNESKFANMRQTGTQGNLNTYLVGKTPIPLPPFEEQRAIAKVLGVVDSVIAKTDEVIGKTERLKKGLMQTLLTRGIGHKEFRETEIGKIPKTWKVVKIKDIAEINKESVDPSKKMPDKTFLYVDIDSVEEETGKIRNPKRILGKEAPSRARRVIHVSDVIMSTVRPYLRAFAIVPKELDNQICSTGFAVLSCKNNIIPYFLLSVLFSDKTIIQCNRMMVGGQYPALNQSQVAEIKIPLPPLYEQQKIADTILAVDRKLEFERSEKARLERIKQSLMDLLLTGKIRIRVD
uniref:Restriction endonuclease subunit S n=1 Tax=candidate division WOR-3 bacterium TaxID=2052148 RepID=A0A7C2P9M1_UNCW3